MKLFKFAGGETDWVAADTEAAAREILKEHYGITDDDIDYSYDTISEVLPPESVRIIWDYEDDDPSTAAEFMTEPGLVCSTCQ